MRTEFLGFFILLGIIPFAITDASAQNPNLFVSAENPKFSNHFAGSMVVEVVIRDNNIRDTDEGKGEPDVTINGKTLRMVQATDGNWYAYFAHVDFAKVADSTVGLAGGGLDFGEFCSRNTDPSVIGVSLSETDGFAVPREGLSNSSNGKESLSSCTGSLSGVNINNVVRNPKSINTNSNVNPGQIGLDPNAWPLIQLYSFDDVKIQYNAAGGTQTVNLEFDEIPNISFDIDRDVYPQNSEVFLIVNDIQLNQDPTDEDSWTFNIDSPQATFYQAYDNSGNNATNGGPGLVNLLPFLSELGFENNGELTIDLDSVMELKQNNDQPDLSVTNGVTYSKIVTLVENSPNSGVFENFDSGDQANIGIKSDAPRGRTGLIAYNDESISVLTGFSTASVSLSEPKLAIGSGQSLLPGNEYPVILEDPDQNINTGAREDLDVFRETALIPTIKIGNPITLAKTQEVKFHTSSANLGGGENSNFSFPDSKSHRVFIDTSNVANDSYEVISINLGITASTLSSILLDVTESNTFGTNWINYDLRSFEKDLSISNFDDTSFSVYFGSLSSSPITIVDAGEISSSQGFIRIDDSDVGAISNQSGTVFLVIDFDSSNNDSGIITISNETKRQPIIVDFFSFGLKNDKSINNSIYRFELEETADNSSTFEGTFEYSVTNQLNIIDPNFIRSAQTISDQVKVIVTDELTDDEGISISYSDIDEVGVITTTSAKSDISTHSGTVSTSSTTYRFGQPVTIILNDPDLNSRNDRIESFTVINDPNSPNVDTVGKNGEILLEIKLKDIRYKRCTIDGIEHGGLASTGFALVETGPRTGVFEGVFKMPSQICDKSGSKLISTAGGSIDVRYFDARDSSGNPNIFSLQRTQQSVLTTKPTLTPNQVLIPEIGSQEITLSGTIDGRKSGIPLTIVMTSPDGTKQSFGASVNNNGGYKAVFTVNPDSLAGFYNLDLFYDGRDVGSVSFTLIGKSVPDWLKINARWWSSNTISDSEFIDGIKRLIEEGVISVPTNDTGSGLERIPSWMKNTAKWWSEEKISDREFTSAIEYLVKKGIIGV